MSPAEVFATARPWTLAREVIDQAVDRADDVELPADQELGEVSAFDQEVYRAICVYRRDDSMLAWPSERTIARDLAARGIRTSQPTVHRAKQRLRKAGWLRLVERRLTKRSGWWRLYHVHECVAPMEVAWEAVKSVVRRAHKSARGKFSRTVNRNREGGCSCWACRVVPTGIRRRPTVSEPLDAHEEVLYRQWEMELDRLREERRERRRATAAPLLSVMAAGP